MSGKEETRQPLAYRMSPVTLDEYVGQEHIVGKGRILRRMIEADMLSSVILFGPPGVGKTALARVIAHSTASRFEQLNAVTAGVGDIKRIVSDASNPLLSEGRKTVLFIDEIQDCAEAIMTGDDGCTMHGCHLRHDALHVEIRMKQGFVVRLFLQIDFHKILKLLPQMSDSRGFPDLTGTTQQHRLMDGTRRPLV